MNRWRGGGYRSAGRAAAEAHCIPRRPHDDGGAECRAGASRQQNGFMRERPNTGRAHIPALDGLRGIAILWVMLHHFARVGAEGAALDTLYARAAVTGRIGVDLFFVLSGFLITRILVETKGRGSYFKAFYGRRFLRIVPLYYAALVLALTVLPWLLGQGAGAVGLRQNQPWFWLYGVNYLIARDGWRAAAGLEHFWSLAVEEQFYLVWPLIVALASGARLLLVSAAGLVAAPVLRTLTLLLGGGYEDLYVASHLRFDGFLAGAVIALVLRRLERPERLWPWTAAVVGAGVVGKAWMTLAGLWWPAGPWAAGLLYTATSLWCGALLLCAVTAPAGSLVGRALGSRPLLVAGTYSYALYIFHVAVRDGLLSAGLSPDRVPAIAGSALPGQMAFNAVAVAASLAVAAASWHLLEKHFLALKRLFPYAAPAARPAPSRGGS